MTRLGAQPGATLLPTSMNGDALDESHSPVTLLSVVEAVFRRPRLVFGLPLVAALVVGIVGLVRHRTYTSSAQFVPQSSDMSLSRVAGLAAQFGVSVPGANPSQSPDAYAALVTSRSSLESLVDSTYRFDADGRRYAGNLVELYKTPGPSPAARREKAIKDLGKAISVDIGLKSGIISIKVRSKWAPLAQQLCQHVLDYVNAHNLATRQSQARAEEEFYRERLGQAAQELRAAEDALEAFSASNRGGVVSSPRLSRDEERLRRAISMRQQVYTSLVQAHDQASLDALHDTPVISIIDQPNLPNLPDSRLLAIKVVLAGIAAFLVAIGIAMALNAVHRRRVTDPELFAYLTELRRAAVARLLFRGTP